MGERAALVALIVSVTIACGSSSNESAPQDAVAETPPTGCRPGEILAGDGHCEPAGIPPDHCAAGFTSDGQRGCNAILPADSCPSGTMAVPGESACREVAPCAEGTWGDIPIEANTQFVDATFAGTSDGSAKAPWKTITAGISAAASGAIVAIAAGRYAEDVKIGASSGFGGKPVRLWGRCPAMVEVVGSASAYGAIVILAGAKGTEIRNLSVRGDSAGIFLVGANGVVVDRVWVHDTSSRSFDIEDTLGASSITVTGSLAERGHEFGIYMYGSDATFEACVVRDTQSRSSDKIGGTNFQIQHGKTRPSNATIRGSLVERGRMADVYVLGSNATVEATVVRATLPGESDQRFGRGIGAEEDAGFRSSLTLRGSIVEGNLDSGVFVQGSDATIDDSVVRNTGPQASDKLGGWGLTVEDSKHRSTLALHTSLIQGNLEVGVFLAGVDATLETMIVRDTSPSSHGTLGRGINIQNDPPTGERTMATIHSSVIEASHDLGVYVVTSDAIIDATLVRDTKAALSDGLFGDGIGVLTEGGSSSVAITGSRIEASARAGVSNFGGAVSLGATTLECNAIALDGEAVGDAAFSFDDLGGNTCSCAGAPATCQVLSSGLAKPSPIGLRR